MVAGQPAYRGRRGRTREVGSRMHTRTHTHTHTIKDLAWSLDNQRIVVGGEGRERYDHTCTHACTRTHAQTHTHQGSRMVAGQPAYRGRRGRTREVRSRTHASTHAHTHTHTEFLLYILCILFYHTTGTQSPSFFLTRSIDENHCLFPLNHKN